MARTPAQDEAIERFLTRLSRRAYVRARRRLRTKSRTLYEAIRDQRDGTLSRFLFIPHYWAAMVNDGRRPIVKRDGFLIWFENPRMIRDSREGKRPRGLTRSEDSISAGTTSRARM